MIVSEFFNRVGFKVNTGDVNKVNSKALGVIGIGFSLTQKMRYGVA